MNVEMNKHAAEYLGFLTYLGALTVVSIVGLYVGWYHALWVWVLPLLTGYGTDDCECDCRHCQKCPRHD